MRRMVAGLAMLVAVLAGCGLPSFGGTAGPAPFVGIEMPPRPRELDVRDVNPCDLLTEAQQAELGLQSDLLFSPSVGSLLFEGPDPRCTARAFDPRSFCIGIALPYDGLGIGAFTGRPVRSTLSPLDVQGFPAVLARPDGDPLFCQVVVDVGPGQAVSVQFSDGGRRTIAQDDLCAGAEQVAGAAMATLLSLT